MAAPKEEYESLFWEGEGFDRKPLFDDNPYMATHRFAQEASWAKVKGIPGCRASKVHGQWIWRLPREVEAHFGWDGRTYSEHKFVADLPLREHQHHGLSAVLMNRDQFGFVLEHATGGGKTLTGIQWRLFQPGARTLIIVPAIVVPNWHREFAKWNVGEEGVTITSWHNLHKVCREKFDRIIADEIHNAKNARSRMGEAFGILRLTNPAVPILGMTATFMMKEAIDLWHPLHCLFPGRFGTYWQFARRYCLLEHNEYGVGVYGLNPRYSSELRWRLDAIAHTVTKDQLPLPTINPLMRYVKKPRCKDLKELFRKSTSAKIDTCVDLFMERKEEGAKKLVVMAHYRQTATDTAAALRSAGFKVWHTSGEHSVRDRDAIIEDWKAADEGVLVVTIFSVKEGIRLSNADEVAYLELIWSPGAATQSIGRFGDITMAGRTVNVWFIVVENSLEERQAAVLERRYREQAAVRESDKEKLAVGSALVVQLNEQETLAELSALELPDMDFDEADL